MKRWFISAVALLSLPALAICLNPFGCDPNNYDECMQLATGKPTEIGVRLATQQCYAKFKKPEEDRAAAAKLKRAEVIAAAWPRLAKDLFTVSDIKKALGEPDFASNLMPCTALEGKPKPTTTCRALTWKDWRPGHVCFSQTDEAGLPCSFKLEVFSPGDTVWIWWPDSF